MNDSICGVDCTKCPMNEACGGCVQTDGHPFGGECTVAQCCKLSGKDRCESFANKTCSLKVKLIQEFNSLKIKDMERITDLNSLCGSLVNLEYTLENGQKIKLLQDEKIYLGNQVCKKSSDRCYGIVADENYLLVCEYGENGTDPEIILYKKREK